jgi:hypothetical protein
MNDDPPRAESNVDRHGEGFAKWLFGLSVLVAAATASYAISRPVTWLVRVVPDDTFYYLQIAANIANKGRSTFDGVNPTAGYHPGWMFIVVTLACVFRGKMALLRACLGAALLLHLAAGYQISRVFRRWMSPQWSWIGGACWILNPLPVVLALEGLEGSLYVFALTVALWVYVWRIEDHLASGSIPVWNMTCLGLAFGFCVLGRTDQAILCAVAALALMWPLTWNGRLRLVAVTGGVTLLTVLPWVVYSHLATGAWFQDSGSMKLLWARKEHTDGITGAWQYLTGEWLTYPLWSHTIDRLGHRWPNARWIAGAAMTAGLIAVLVRAVRRPDTRALAGTALILVAGTLLTGSIYGLFFTDRKDWYTGQPGLILYVVLFGVVVIGVLEKSDRWRARAAAVGGGSVALFAGTTVMVIVTANWYPWQLDVFESQPVFERLVPAGLDIGCFNAGIPAYFSDRHIVNVDGLVNNAIHSYYARDELDQYFRDAHIDYIADEDLSLKRAMLFVKKPMPMDVLATAPLTWWQGDRHLWRLAGAQTHGTLEASSQALP